MMKKILLLIFIAMPCVAYSGSFVRHGYLFHYDDTVTAKGSYQIAIGVSAGDDLTDWNAALITMGGEEWKYLTMYYSSISKSDISSEFLNSIRKSTSLLLVKSFRIDDPNTDISLTLYLEIIYSKSLWVK